MDDQVSPQSCIRRVVVLQVIREDRAPSCISTSKSQPVCHQLSVRRSSSASWGLALSQGLSINQYLSIQRIVDGRFCAPPDEILSLHLRDDLISLHELVWNCSKDGELNLAVGVRHNCSHCSWRCRVATRACRSLGEVDFVLVAE